MNKNNTQPQILIDKFLNGKANEEEVSQLNSWYNSFEDNEIELQDISNEELINARHKMLISIKDENKIENAKSQRSNFVSIIWKVAAVLILVTGISFYLTQTESTPAPEITLVTKTTQLGQKTTITLSDGSTIKLNSGSSISYPQGFDKDSREIELTGEAFFEVAKDAKRPFRVKTGEVTTIALGTSFNINAYPNNKNIDVSLATGKVKVESSDYTKKAIDPIYLMPGEKASYNISTLYFKKQKFDTEEMLGWKDGIIYFKKANESDLVEKLKKWYGVDIEVTNQAKKTIDITTKFENSSLENVLESLSYTLGFKYSVINNKKVTITYEN
jgi:ferric-dicitrate binding protein FerR (iron transport regulator)